MIKSTPLILLFILSFFKGECQNSLTITDEKQSIYLGKYLSYFIDKEKKYSITDITSHKCDAQFIPCTQSVPNLGNLRASIWNKLTVINKSSKKWLLVEETYSTDTVTLYTADSTGYYRATQLGFTQFFSDRKYKTNHYVFDLEIEPGDTAVFYIKIDTYFASYPLLLLTHEKFIQTYHNLDWVKGMYYGFLLLIILYNTVIYFTVKDKNYLYYILYVFLVGLGMLHVDGYIAQLQGKAFHFLSSKGPVLIGLMSVFSFVFAKNFLEIKKHAPGLNKIISYFFIPAYIIIISLSISGNNLWASILNQFIGLLGLIYLSYTALVVYKRGFIPARYYIFACGFYFIGVLIYILRTMNILPHNDFTHSAMELGSAIEMMLFSISLADKINLYKKEKETAQENTLKALQENERIIKNQNIVLEQKVKDRTKEIEFEKQKSDDLLLNILPTEIAEELKENGFSEARYYDNVSVLFTDFANFTGISTQLTPAQLVHELHECFTMFDEIIDKYGLEKIKTIGDAYLAVCGLPIENKNHATNTALAAIEIVNKTQERLKNGGVFNVRIGINSGPVVAGIVGIKKFQFDIWGDTVNVASRLENTGEISKINISGNTYELLKDQFNCVYRGKIAAKNKGEIDMYFLESKKS